MGSSGKRAPSVRRVGLPERRLGRRPHRAYEGEDCAVAKLYGGRLDAPVKVSRDLGELGENQVSEDYEDEE